MKDIENIRNARLLLKEIKRQNDEFDMAKFYLSQNGKNGGGAVQIITPSHKLSCFANKSHRLVVENIYRLIYSDFRGFKTGIWQEESCDKGNILLQLCSNGCSLVWVPKRITDFQFKSLSFSYAMMQSLNYDVAHNGLVLPDVDMSLVSPLHMETNLTNDSGEMLSIEEALPKIKSRVLVKK